LVEIECEVRRKTQYVESGKRNRILSPWAEIECKVRIEKQGQEFGKSNRFWRRKSEELSGRNRMQMKE